MRPLAAPRRDGGTEGITELPRIVAKVLFGDEVLGDVPVFDVRERMSLSSASCCAPCGLGVGFSEVGLAIVPDDLKDGFVAPEVFSYST